MESCPWAGLVFLQPRKTNVSWPASKEWAVGDSVPLTPCLWDPTWSTTSSSGVLSTGKIRICCSQLREGPWKWYWAWAPLLWRHAERHVGVVQSGEEQVPGRSSSTFQYLKGLTIKLERGILPGSIVTGQWSMVSTEREQIQRRCKNRTFYDEGGEILEQVSWRRCKCPILGSVQG